MTAETILAAVLPLIGMQTGLLIAARRRLTALRRNCFVTNERGHRVRWAAASEDVRNKAERI